MRRAAQFQEFFSEPLLTWLSIAILQHPVNAWAESNMELEGWARDSDGKVEVYPLVAFETLVVHGVMCALKVHYLESPAELETGEPSSVPLILRPEMARGLAAALIRSADQAESGPRDRTAH